MCKGRIIHVSRTTYDQINEDHNNGIVIHNGLIKETFKFYNQNRDRIILSKGHGCLAYYSALCEYGFINENDLKNFEKNASPLLGHPVKNKKIGKTI